MNGKGKDWRTCIGTLHFADGDKYEGDWADCQMEGNGTATFNL